jgi:HEAT repeat protein
MWGWLRRLFGGSAGPRLRVLLRQVRDADPETRRQAAVQLGAVADPRAMEELVSLLQDTHTTVREASAASLRQFGVTTFPALRRGLDHANPDIARVAAELLGELRQVEAVEPLLIALKYSARPVQLAAKRALVQCGGLAVPFLEAARTEPQPWVRQQIEEILGQIEPGNTSAQP